MWEKYSHIVAHISIGPGVSGTVAEWVCSDGHLGKYQNVLVVCDPNTYQVAGMRVIGSLKAAGLITTEFCFPEDEPLPDEHSIGRILAAFTPDIDIIIGIGGGTINDLCTYVGSQVGRPSAIVATAPSMDGYASLGSAMLFGGVKVTPMTQCPAAIFCDTDILALAPMRMITAGLGDMLGKITSLADWRLSHILTGEAMPASIAGIMEEALEKIIASASLAVKHDAAAIRSITEGLILSGIAMSLYGDSRPASGTEHHLSHFWEMRMLARGQKPSLHGETVGLATLIALLMWQELARTQGDGSPHQGGGSLSSRESEISRLYGQAADAILKTKNPNLPLEHIAEHWLEIIDVAKSLPSPEDIAALLSSAGMHLRPKMIGLDADTLKDSIIYARERKKTYTLLQLLGDLDLLEDYAVLAERYFAHSALSGVKCFILDMDGTIYLGNRLFPYTHGFLAHLDSLGKDYAFFTNNSSQNAAHYIDKLHSMGIMAPECKLLTSTHVLLEHLEGKYSPPAVFIAGTKALMEDFKAEGYIITDEKPEFCVLGFDTDMDYNRLTKLCGFIRDGVPVYGVNMDFNCPVDGGFVPDCGTLAAAVCASTGVSPEFYGKPSRLALDYIARKTGYREDELCFVGDRLYTDVAITEHTEARSALVLSGETKRVDLQETEHIPDLVVNDLQELISYIT